MLSSLSVSKSPAGRLRHWCSSRYLRISPLHREFRLPLLHSRKTVSKAVHRLSRWISLLTCSPAYAPFTPSKSGQRLPPTYYRGCWHVVSRGFLLCYRHYRHRGQQFTIRLIRRESIFQRIAPLVSDSCELNTSCGISVRFQTLFPSERQVTHVLLTRPPLSARSKLLSLRSTCMC